MLTKTLHRLGTAYWPLVKMRQTALLTLTGVAGYFSAHPAPEGWPTLLLLTASLLLAISGSTTLNMWFDRDLDARMRRTARRPLSTGLLPPRNALALGLTLTILGLLGAAAISPLCALITLAGLFFEIIVYTLWLKRRSPWSILWGGLAGGMPILAGRAVGLGQVDLLGVWLVLAIVLWIPTHNLSLNLLHAQDYQAGGIPTFPACYGPRATRRTIVVASLLAATAMNSALAATGTTPALLGLLLALSAGLFGLAGLAWQDTSGPWMASLYKYASLYMLGAMLLLTIG